MNGCRPFRPGLTTVAVARSSDLGHRGDAVIENGFDIELLEALEMNLTAVRTIRRDGSSPIVSHRGRRARQVEDVLSALGRAFDSCRRDRDRSHSSPDALLLIRVLREGERSHRLYVRLR